MLPDRFPPVPTNLDAASRAWTTAVEEILTELLQQNKRQDTDIAYLKGNR